MRTAMTLATCLVVLQLTAAPEAPPSHPDSTELVEPGVRYLKKKQERCTYHVDKQTFDAQGNKMRADKDEKSKRKIAERLSFPLVFRSGRFRLIEPIAPEDNPKQHVIVRYVPHPEHEQLTLRKGDDEDLEKVLNALTGFIFIDPGRLDITEIRGNLAASVSLRVWHNIIPVTIQRLDFTYSERYDERWLPYLLKATVVYKRPNVKFWKEQGGEFRDEYIISFSCPR